MMVMLEWLEWSLASTARPLPQAQTIKTKAYDNSTGGARIMNKAQKAYYKQLIKDGWTPAQARIQALCCA